MINLVTIYDYVLPHAEIMVMLLDAEMLLQMLTQKIYSFSAIEIADQIRKA